MCSGQWAEPPSGGHDQALLLDAIHACRRASIAPVRSGANLDKHKRVLVPNRQINFAEAAAKLASQHSAARCRDQASGQTFEMIACRLCRAALDRPDGGRWQPLQWMIRRDRRSVRSVPSRFLALSRPSSLSGQDKGDVFFHGKERMKMELTGMADPSRVSA